jgi:hypothetical protein
MAKRAKCPHCGNSDPNAIESNGSKSDPTLLCVAKMKPEEAALLPYGFDPKTDIDSRGFVSCGQQWCPEVA